MPSQSKALQWTAAIAAALAAHSLLLLGYARLGGYGAAGEGQGGIEIGLGLLGNMGEALVDSDAAEVPERAPDPAPEQSAPDLPQPQPPQPEPQSAAPVPEPVRQLTEVAVQTETSELVAELRRNEPAPAAVENTPSEGGEAGAARDAGNAGEAAVTQRRRSSGIGDSGSAGGSAGRSASYVAQLAAQLNRHKHYPMAARRSRQEGTVTLLLVIRRDGSISDFRISESSGWDALDAAALRMLERAQPLPPFPASMKEEEFRMTLPVSFSLNPL